MTDDDLFDICSAVRYKPTWRILFGPKADGFYVQWAFFAEAVESEELEEQRGRKWYVSAHCTRSEVVQTLLKAAITAEEHEAREWFRYKDVAVFGPHLDVDLLAAVQLPESRRVG